MMIHRPFGYVFPNLYWIETSTDDFVAQILWIGVATTLFGALVAFLVGGLRGTTGQWLGDLVALGAATFGTLLCWHFLQPRVCGRHLPRLIELAIGAACYLPTAEASRYVSHLRWPLLVLLWFGLATSAADHVWFWGGLARITFLDLTLFAAVFAPVALAFAKRS